eukprot:7013370-Heterocapsa_arctica.AAC.1
MQGMDALEKMGCNAYLEIGPRRCSSRRAAAACRTKSRATSGSRRSSRVTTRWRASPFARRALGAASDG